MQAILLAIGHLAYWAAWPVFWLYFRLDHGRTRVVLVRGDSVLVVKQWISNGKWQLPGGGIHKGEPIVTAALRELYEETGLRLRPGQLRPAGQALQRTRGVTFTMHVFWAPWDGPDIVRLQRYELAAAAWMLKSDLNSGNARIDTLTAFQMIQ